MTLSRNGITKSFKVRFRKGDPLRRVSESIFKNALFPASPNIENALFNKEPADIERHFEINPALLSWSLVTLDNQFSDKHLYMLRWLPEIESVQIYSNRITDRGIRQLRHLTAIKELLIYSPKVTNRSMTTISALKHLEILDMQGANEVDLEVYLKAVSTMRLKRSWPPHPERNPSPKVTRPSD